VDDKIAKGNMELNDEVKMRLTDDEKISHATRGVPTKRLLRASNEAGVKSAPCYWVSAPKFWLTK
jgi:hypothetical protein